MQSPNFVIYTGSRAKIVYDTAYGANCPSASRSALCLEKTRCYDSVLSDLPRLARAKIRKCPKRP